MLFKAVKERRRTSVDSDTVDFAKDEIMVNSAK